VPLDLLLRWPAKVVEEIVLAPWTVARVRGALTELPERIEALSGSLDETITMLGSVLPGVDERLEALAGNVGRLDAAVTSLAADPDPASAPVSTPCCPTRPGGTGRPCRSRSRTAR